MSRESLDLFSPPESPSDPPGFDYRENFIDRDEESALAAEIEALELAPYEFRGVEARRRVISFGYQHDYRTRRLRPSVSIPPFLAALQAKVAHFAALRVEDFQQVLISEYSPGTPIGWHKDRERYDRIVGVSFRMHCYAFAASSMAVGSAAHTD